MQARERSWLIRTAWAVLVAALAMLLGLSLGRPLYYTDGEREVSAFSLVRTGMWVWSSPQPELLLPGPVRGRVAQLPDGRLLYARAVGDGDSDLVTFDPRHPQAGVETAVALCSPYHDLAPGVATDGTIWFASDRPGGVGGFDLYRSHVVGDSFAAPVAVAACNTMFDETDPAPDPAGGAVFARVDRAQRGGDDGVLYGWDGGELEPRALFGAPASARPVDRDPVFAPDGSALWFVRQQGASTALERSARLRGVFDPPVRQDASWGTGALRSPLPLDGQRLGLLRPARGDDVGDQWLVSRGREVLPWWTGQRWLETFLLGAALAAAVVLVLLYLGQRWRSLDLVTLCLLLSLLVHLLLMLWLMGVEVAGSLRGGDEDAGAVQVNLVDGSAVGGGAGDGELREDLAATARFAPAPAALVASTPGSAVTAAGADIVAASAQWSGGGAAPSDTTASAEVHDARTAAAARNGVDADAAVERTGSKPVVAMAAAEATRSKAEAGSITVTVPGARLDAAAAAQEPVVAAAAQLPAAPSADSRTAAAAAPSTTMRDVAAAAARRDGSADRVAAAPAPVAAVAAPTASDARTGARATASTALTAAPPQADLGAAQAAAEPVAASAATAPLPTAREIAATPHYADGRASPAPAAAPAANDASGELGRAALPPMPSPDGGAAAAAAAASRAVAMPSGENVAVPGSALGAAAAAAPAPAVAPAALPTPQARGTPAALALRDGQAGAATVAAAPANGGSPSRAVDAVTLPAVPRADGGPVLQRDATSAAPAASGAGIELPGTALASAVPTIGAADVARALPQAQHGRSSAAPMLRDEHRAGIVAPSTPAARSAAGALQPQPLAAIAIAGDGVRASGRSTPSIGSGRETLAVEPPGSLLRRAAPAGLAASEAGVSGLASPYSNRFGPARQKALEQYGGTVDTERAVRDGLRYLASIQRLDGSWGDADQFDQKYGFVRVGKTALCLLAFLGAGHTPTANTEHAAVTQRALDFLLAQQQRETGAFGVSSAYGHGISTYALAECYGITKDERLRRPIEDALAWILQHQGPRRDRRNQGGWGYFSPGLEAEDDYARVSVSAWMIMALESARMSGIELPEDVLPNARRFLEQAWDQQNRFFRYNHKRSRLQSAWPTLPSSTPAGAFCMLLLGEQKDSDMLRDAVAYTVERRPRAYRRFTDDEFVLEGQGNVYFWYYGTLCCFLAGGDAWSTWNERLRALLPSAQDRDGSWPPIDAYARTAGDTDTERPFTTAMCVLSLEIYYRYFTPLLLGR